MSRRLPYFIALLAVLTSTPVRAETGIDFYRSFISFIEDVNKTGIDDHCHAALIAHIHIAPKNGKATDYYLAATALSQDTFNHLNTGNVFTLPSYQFSMIAGSKDVLFSRTGDTNPPSTMASSHHIKGETILRSTQLSPLVDKKAIIKAAQEFLPMQAKVRYKQGDTEVTLEFPIRFMNSSDLQGHFQVNTGPVLIPPENSIEPENMLALRRAFIGFNSLDAFDLLSETTAPASSYRQQIKVKPAQITLYTSK